MQAAANAAAVAEQLAADSFRAASATHAAREAAESAEAAAEARARAAADTACTLERRLVRAREGGRRALAAAQLLSAPET